MSKVALCVGQSTLADPSLIGLSGESLDGQNWLEVFVDATEARKGIAADREIVEVWVVENDEMDPINLAAAIKADRRELRVSMYSSEAQGSFLSRAYAASLDAVYDEKMFVRRYAAAKAALVRPSSELIAPHPSSFTNENGLDVRARPEGSHCEDANLEELHREEPVWPASSFLLPVVSGSGGSGKSTVAALAALCARQHGLKTVLLDFDLQFGNVNDFFGNAESVAVDDLLADPTLIARSSGSSALPFIVSPPEKPEKAELIARKTAYLLDLLSDHFDVVVANSGAYWAEQHAVLLERSSKVLFLIDQRSSSLQSCQRALYLCERCGIPTGSFLFAVNRCSKNALLSSIDVSCALKGAEAVELKDGGRDVEDCSCVGQIVDLAISENPLYTSLEGVISSFVPGFDDGLLNETKRQKKSWITKRRGLIRKKEEK